VPLGIRHRKQKRPKASPSKKYEPLTIPQSRGGQSNSRGEPRIRNASFSQTSTVHIHGDPSSLRRARWNFLRDREDGGKFVCFIRGFCDMHRRIECSSITEVPPHHATIDTAAPVKRRAHRHRNSSSFLTLPWIHEAGVSLPGAQARSGHGEQTRRSPCRLSLEGGATETRKSHRAAPPLFRRSDTARRSLTPARRCKRTYACCPAARWAVAALAV
jgi:hypothetical protein